VQPHRSSYYRQSKNMASLAVELQMLFDSDEVSEDRKLDYSLGKRRAAGKPINPVSLFLWWFCFYVG
jgi:hypothetical protein